MNLSCIESGATYECVGCGRGVCGDCEPSPREADHLGPCCYWIEDPDGDAA